MNSNRVSVRNDDSPEVGNMHFRLCHLCLNLNESEQDIEQCVKCLHVFKDESLLQFWNNDDHEAFSDQLTTAAAKVEESVDDSENEVLDTSGQVNGLNAKF